MWITGDMILAEMKRGPKQPVLAVDPLGFKVPNIPELPELTEDNRNRPVIALDVDGVLNVLGGAAGPRAQEIETVIPAWATARARYLRGHGRLNMPGRITLDPDHGQWLLSLIERGCDIVWVTTWETAAPVVIGPLLGLPPLPVLLLGEAAGYRDGSVDVKAQELLKAFTGRPLVWLDDHNERYRDGAFRPAYWPTLVPHLDGSTGLTQSVRDQVDDWLAANPRCGAQTVDQVFVDKLVTSSDRFARVKVRISTGDGVLTLHGYDRGYWLVYPSGKLRTTHDLGASEWVNGLQSENMWYRLDTGSALTFLVKRGAGEQQKEVITAPITKIEVLESEDVDLGRQKYQRLPELSVAKDLQTQASEIGRGFGFENVAFKQGWGISCWAKDTPLELEVKDKYYVTIKAKVVSGEQDGTPIYQWQRLYLGTQDGLGSSQVAPFHPLHPLNPVMTMELLGKVWQDFTRKRDCTHVLGDLYCRNCGTWSEDTKHWNDE